MLKFLLIDACGLMFRCYYSVFHLKSASAHLVNKLTALITVLKKINTTYSPDHIVFFFDSINSTYRKKIYQYYKINREKIIYDLLLQISWMKETCKSYGYSVIECMGHEADDFISSSVVLLSEYGSRISVFSADKDLTQIIQNDIQLIIPIKISVNRSLSYLFKNELKKNRNQFIKNS